MQVYVVQFVIVAFLIGMLCGYRFGSKHAREEMQAIYKAISRYGNKETKEDKTKN